MQDETLLTSEELQNQVPNSENENAETQQEQEGASAESQDINTILQENQQLKVQLEEAKEQALRLQADFVNFRKRKDKEMTETIAYANEGLIKQLLPILDDFDRTLAVIEKTDNLAAIKEGIGMVAKNLMHIFNKIGVEPINAKGTPFDSELHEAITSVSVEEEAQKGLVFDEVEKGYKLKEKVIRFSKVVVGE